MKTKTLAIVALALGLFSALVGRTAAAQLPSFPSSFHTRQIATNGTSIFVRVGGTGPAVVLLHGYGETGDMWAGVAAALAPNHTVIVPDLRGMGRSAVAAGGYDKKTQGFDIAGVLDSLKIGRVDLVTHDIGNMVGYAFAAEHRGRVRRFVLIDAPVPGIGPWDEITRGHRLWHFSFWGPDEDRLVAGRERIYLDRFWNEFSANPKSFPEASRMHYASIYAQSGRMHAGFEQFRAFDQDAIDNRAFLTQGKLTMPVLAVGGEQAFGPMMATVMRAAATDVHEAIVPKSGHWVTEENPAATIALLTGFIDAAAVSPASSIAQSTTQIRTRPTEFDFGKVDPAGTGSSGVAGIQTIVLKGDPTKAGIYTILIRVPAHTRIAAHSHPDDRVATVVSGTWYIGYGHEFDAAKVRALPAGSFYTEPPGEDHFAETRDEPVLVQISGAGPTGTTYVRKSDDPRP